MQKCAVYDYYQRNSSVESSASLKRKNALQRKTRSCKDLIHLKANTIWFDT